MSNTPALLAPNAPIVDPKTGLLTQAGFRFLLAIWSRTGAAQGVDIVVVQETAGVASDNSDFALFGLADVADPPPPDMSLFYDVAVDPPIDMGQAALLALAIGDIAD